MQQDKYKTKIHNIHHNIRFKLHKSIYFPLYKLKAHAIQTSYSIYPCQVFIDPHAALFIIPLD